MLLVVGKRGVGAMKRMLLGSVSDYCVHHAPCAVTYTNGRLLSTMRPKIRDPNRRRPNLEVK
jgi:Universal stress protein family